MTRLLIYYHFLISPVDAILMKAFGDGLPLIVCYWAGDDGC